MRILLTGSSGTIGTRLFERLLPEHDVTGVDIRQNKWHLELNRKTVNLDIRQSDAMDNIDQDFDLIVHFAANARIYELVKDPGMALDNMLINFNVAEFARKRGIKRIIFASSRETYGNLRGGPVSEEMMRVENCESPYSASKLMGEALHYAYERVYGVGFVIIRFSNVYRMYDDSDRVIPLWLRQCWRNEDLVVFGKKKILDFAYIEDSVTGVVKIIGQFDHVQGNVFNIAYGQGISLLYVAERIRELTGSRNQIILKENRPGEVWEYQADITKAKRLLNYAPAVDIEAGLQKTTEWYESKLNLSTI